MTTPTAAYLRLVIYGDISLSQTWSCGLAMSPPPTLVNQGDLDALLAAAEPLLSAWWGSSGTTGVGSVNAADTRLLGVRAYLYGSGTGPADLQAIRDRVTPLTGAGNTPSPTQTCLVATMLTGLSGRSYKGRCYTPSTALTLDATHQASQTQTDRVAGAWRDLINGLNGVAAPEFGRVQVHGSRGNYPVTAVRVDSEPDIQRRRADKIIAARRSIQPIT